MIAYHPRVADEDNELPVRRGSRLLLLAIPLALLAAAGFFFYTQYATRAQLETTPGHPAGAVIVTGDRGATLVVIDRVSRSGGHRFTAVDLATGKAIGSRVIDEPARCWAASAGRMWCGDDDGHVHLIAVPTFDAAQASDADQASRSWLGKAELVCALEDSALAGDVRLSFGGGNPRPLVVGDAPAGSDTPTYYSPAFLHVVDPALVLVQHDANQDRPDPQVSRLDPDHHEMWTADLGGRCETANTVDGKLVVTTRDAAHRATAIDLSTGKVLWSYAR